MGRLAPGAADYYLGEVATSAEDYYTGHGESEGRWAGSLAAQLGLEGAVEPAHFRAVLEGRHPFTGEQLVSSRARSCLGRRPAPGNQPGLFDADSVDVAQAAARLRMSTRHVRRLLAVGERSQHTGVATAPGKALFGSRCVRPAQPGLAAWSIPRGEVERLESERRAVKARPGYDLTLRPPKSVSVLWALADAPRRQAIRDAHRAAVAAVVDYYEAHATYARRGSADRGRVATEGLIAAAFDHRTSRAGDPLLHTHVVAANMTLTAEGKWQAIDGRPIYQHARPAGFLYQAHLRHLLTKQLGVEFAQVRNGWAEVEGVPTEVVRAFSKRRDEIEELVAESGYTSARSHQAATLATRNAKDYGVDAATLEQRWRHEAESLGFGRDQVERCFGRSVELPEPDPQTLFARLGGPEGLTRQAATFTRGEVVEAVSQAVGAAAPATRVEYLADAFLASDHVRPLMPAPGHPGYQLWRHGGVRENSADLARYSTPELLGLEERVLAWAKEGFGTPVPSARLESVDAVLARRPDLSDEQAAMVRSTCGHSPALQAIAGQPGSGKTYATAACVEAFVGSGVPVVGCALSAAAAAELEAAAKLGERTGRPATTIARLLLDASRSGLPQRCVVIVDEASMVGTRDLARLGAHAAAVGGAIKLVGDPDQHGPVETGGAFRRLVVDQGEDVPHLVRNNRQLDPTERAAIEDFRHELVDTALARYDAAGRLLRAPSASRCYQAMVEDWLSGVHAGLSDPMIAGTNGARRVLNDWARSRLKAEGTLSGPALVVDGREFCVGEWVVARKNASHLRSPDGRAWVKNRSAGVVVALDQRSGSLTVDFTPEGRIEVPASYLAGGHLEHGYARTTYLVQGATLERVLYHAGDRSSFEEGYVALTRGRRETRIYIVDGALAADDDTAHRAHEYNDTGLDTVCAALERRRSKELALDTDPVAAECVARYGGLDLAELRAQRRRLESMLSTAPDCVDEKLADTAARRDALLARRQAWAHLAEQVGCSPRSARRRPRSRSASDPQATARVNLESLERRIAKVEHQLGELEHRAAERAEFLDEHVDELDQLRLVRRAELARELQVRALAAVSPAAALVAEKERTSARTADSPHWLHAAQRLAVYQERYGCTPVQDGDLAERVAGTRPSELDAAWSYDRVVAALRLAVEGEERFPAVAEPAGVEVASLPL